jgi:hypothetical protein
VALPRGPDGRSNAATTTATVVYSASTTFKHLSAKSGAVTASGPAGLKVGEFIAVQGTRHGNTVSASAVVAGGGPPPVTPPRGRTAPRSG